MSYQLHNYVIPWINPALPASLKAIIYANGQKVLYKKDEVALYEYEKMDKLLFIEKGLFGQAIINLRDDNKPFAMNLFTPDRLMGFLSLYSGSSSARRIMTLQDSVVISISHNIILPLLENNFSLYRDMACYCELCSRSELSGMVGLFTMTAEDRLRLLFVILLCSAGYIFDKNNTDEWVRLPYSLRRRDIQKIIYSSQITLDRLFSEWNKKGFIQKDRSKALLVKISNLYPIYEWVLQQ